MDKAIVQSVTPEIHVTDVEAVARLLELIGFKRGYALIEGNDLDFVIMVNRPFNIFVHHMLPDDQRQAPKPYRLYFTVTDINATRQLLVSNRYAPSDIEKTNYGALLFHMEGPDRVQFWFHQFTK